VGEGGSKIISIMPEKKTIFKWLSDEINTPIQVAKNSIEAQGSKL
jgi:hypothetical protein